MLLALNFLFKNRLKVRVYPMACPVSDKKHPQKCFRKSFSGYYEFHNFRKFKMPASKGRESANPTYIGFLKKHTSFASCKFSIFMDLLG